MSQLVHERYEPAIRPARLRFATNPAMAVLNGADPVFLELFLINFCSLGVGLTRPVEGWLKRSSRRCADAGLPELGRALLGHAEQEAGHDQMMVADTHALVARWNPTRFPDLDADQLLARDPTPGGRKYQQLHEDTIAGETPYAQVAIEYEIELLPVQFGPQVLALCRGTLGPSILADLSFLREHITLDVAHSRFNEVQLDKLLQKDLGYLPALVRAGAAALDAYAAFLNDCVRIARDQARAVTGAAKQPA